MPNQNQRPELRRQAGQARTQVTARPQEYLGALPAGNPELEGLVKGLSQFNPTLSHFASQQLEEKRVEVATEANAAAQREERPRDALTGEPMSPPSTVPPAFDDQYRRSYGQALAQRAAIENRSDLVASYSREKDVDGFNLDQFLAKGRSAALQGVQDPHVASIIGAHMMEAEAAIRGQAQQDAVQKHEEQRLTTASRLTEGFTPDMTPEQLAKQHFDWYVPQMRSIQVDPKQSAALLLNRVKALSNQAGGRPDLFEAFGQKDAEGFTILDRNPQLGDHIAQAKDQAIRQRDTALKEAKEPALAKLLIGYDDDVRQAPERVTTERLVSDVASGSLSPEKAAGLHHDAQVELGKKLNHTTLVGAADRGMLGFYDPKDQNKVLDEMLGAASLKVWEAAQPGGDPRQIKVLVESIMQRHSRTGATVPVDSLQRLMETTVSNLPGAEGPSPKFLATAEIYKAMAGDQRYRGLYFKGDTDEVMAAFAKHTAGGVDAKAAYAAAYRVIDPAFKEQARKRAEGMKDSIAVRATKNAMGSSMWGWLPGGNGRPENQQMLGAWSVDEARRALELNPDLTDKELQDHIERKSSENFILDTTSQLAVKVPPALGGGMAQRALSAYSKAIGETLKGRNEFPEGTSVRYVPLNAEGLYDLQTWTGTRQRSVTNVRLADIVNWHRSATTLSQAEGAQLADVRQALKANQPLPAVDPALLAKGRSVGFFKDAELGQVEKLNRQQVLDRFKAVPDFGYGKPANLAAPLPQKPNVTIDAKTTSRVALELAASPVTGAGFEHMGLAGSLIALREGVSLTVSKDPNPDAGMNIGAGYNLKANAENVNKDLKRAGVPEDRIEDVKAGRAALTPEQAKRLIVNVVPRYEEQTRKTAESTAPGLWQKMTPQQRAVMVDIAYQTGDAAQFRKAWGQLAAGDARGFADETRVFYKNKAGDKVEDTRARELRASMLAGTAEWAARLQIANPN